MASGAPSEVIDRISRHVRDERVLDAIAAVPRERFLPEALRDRAWDDVPLPIGGHQTIPQPLVVAVMCALLELRGDERVLEVGTGSGYHAAVLSRLAGAVVSVERDGDLSRRAATALAACGIDNVTLVVGDGSRGHDPCAPYDAISVAAATRGGVPEALEDQLADGGRLVLPVGGGDEQRLMVVRRRGGDFLRHDAGSVAFLPLVSEDGEPDEAAAIRTIVDLVE